jgi:hypothetical protein
MFDIIIKRKTITLDCFTSNPAIVEHFPIVKANKCYPEWWKNLESHFVAENSQSGISHDTPTLKRCDALLSLYSKGFCIPMWSDLIIETNSQGEYRYQYSADELNPIVSHSERQLGSGFNNMQHLKMLSPWIIGEKTGVDFYFAGAQWNLINNMFKINIVPGVVNFRDQMSTHVNMFLDKKANRIEFTAGKPLVHVMPLSEYNIKIKNHLVTEKEFENKMLRYSFLSSFMGRYKKNAKRK